MSGTALPSEASAIAPPGFGGMQARSSEALNATPRIAMRNLDFYYGDNRALKAINLDLPERQVTGMIGPSGCGKSTLLRVLNRMYSLYPGQRATGEVLMDGQNILDADVDINALRAKVGMVFQKPTPFPMTIAENTSFGIKLHEALSKRQMDERIEWALTRAALWGEVKDRLNSSAMGLSGGQQQRLCIGRAIAVEPEVLLMDEPASALDPISTSAIEDLIHELKSEYTIVIVTHNMQQAARVSDETGFFNLKATGEPGHLVEFNPTSKMFTNPDEESTEAYISGRFG